MLHAVGASERAQTTGNAAAARSWMITIGELLRVHVRLPEQFNSFALKRRGFSQQECCNASLEALRHLLIRLAATAQQLGSETADDLMLWTAGIALWSCGDSTATSGFAVLPNSVTSELVSAMLATITTVASARVTAPTAATAQCFCLACTADMITAATVVEEPALWPPDWALRLVTAVSFCMHCLRQGVQLTAARFKEGFTLFTKSGRQLSTVGAAACYTAMRLVVNAAQCLDSGCRAGGGAVALLSAFSDFLSCPLPVFRTEVLLTAASAKVLMTGDVSGSFVDAAKHALRLADAIVESSRQPEPVAVQAVCQLPRALMHINMLGVCLSDRNIELHTQQRSDGVAVATHAHVLATVNMLVPLVELINGAGSAWRAALARSDASACLLELLDCICNAATCAGQQREATAALQRLCSACSNLLRSEVPSDTGNVATIMAADDWRRRTAAMPAFLRRRLPPAAAQWCCKAVAAVNAEMAGLSAQRHAIADVAMQALLEEEEVANRSAISPKTVRQGTKEAHAAAIVASQL